MGAELRRRALTSLAGLFVLLAGGLSPAAAFYAGPEAAAFSPDGTRLYVANNVLNSIAVLDTTTNQVTAIVPLDSRLPVVMEGMAISPDGTRLFVSAWDYGSRSWGPDGPPNPFGPRPGTVTVLDTASWKVVAWVNVDSSPMGLTISRDGKRVYVADLTGGTVSVIDTSTNQVTADARVGGNPMHVALSPDGGRLYVGNGDNAGIFPVLDTATLGLIAQIVGTGIAPSVVAPSPDGKWVYVTGCCGPSDSVAVIDAGANQVVGQVMTGNSPLGVAFSPDSSRAYVTVNTNPGTVAVIDTAAKQVVDVIRAGYYSPNLVMRPDGKRLYTIDMGAGTVTVIDTGTDQVVAKVPVYLQSAAAGQ